MIVEVISVAGLIIAGVGTYYSRRQVKIAEKGIGVESGEGGASARVGTDDFSESFFDENHYRACLRKETSLIDIRGIAAQDPTSTSTLRVPIDEVYAELHVKAGLTEREVEDQAEGASSRVTLSEVVRVTRCVVLMGDPGGGKTTFLRYLAYKLVDDVSWKWPCGEAAFSAVSGLAEQGAVLPFLLTLPDLQSQLVPNDMVLAAGRQNAPGSDDPNVLLEQLLACMSKLGIHATRANILPILQSGRAIWLLDGMDEVESVEARKRIAEIVSRASVAWPACRFVVTSRPFAIAGLARPKDFEVCSIDVLQDPEIKRFLRSWTNCLFAGASEEKRQEHLLDLTRTILESADLRALARNPVMLTCMGVLHYNRKRLPNSKADLLEAVIQWLLFSRHQAEGTDGTRPEEVESRFRLIAYLMLSQQGNRYQAGTLWAAQKLQEQYEGETQEWLTFLQEERQKSGVIIGRGEGDIAFWHSWFQQYLAAKHIAFATDDLEQGWWHMIAPHVDDNQWREVLSLVPACLRRLGTARVNLFFERLIDDVASADLNCRVKRYGLAGLILQDLQAVGFEVDKNVFTSRAEGIQEVFRTPLVNVPLPYRLNAAAALGIVGDQRLAISEKRWARIEAGKTVIGAQKDDAQALGYDALAVSWEGPVHERWVDEFDIGVFLVTVQDYGVFVNSKGYSNPTYWTDEGWKWAKRSRVEVPLAWEEQLRLPNCPVTGISWFEAGAYCNWLRSTSDDGFIYRLPSEYEWERAARIRIPRGQRFSWGNGLNAGDRAEANWAQANLRCKTPVGMFPISTTGDGIADLFGNVEEWCENAWTDQHVIDSDGGPVLAAEPTKRVVRGGSTIRPMRFCRPSYRSQILQTKRYMTVGFRVIRQRMGSVYEG